MRTPVVLISGQGDTDTVTGTLLRTPGTLVVEHRFDGHVVRRTISTLRNGELTTACAVLELAHGCVGCTVRDDLLVLLRILHRRAGVDRIVVHLAPWLEPQPICWAIDHVAVRVGPGYLDGPAARDVDVAAVVTCVAGHRWLAGALCDDELGDGRSVARVLVDQAEVADVLVLDHPEPVVLAALRRLAPRARITVGPERLEMALAHLESDAPRGRGRGPHGPLLAGEPPLGPDGDVRIVEFSALRPFHPARLHTAIDVLLDGVIRSHGRIWLATKPDHVMWMQSAGAYLRLDNAGRWLVAMSASEAAYVPPERRAMADLLWTDDHGDRHVSMTILVCGADADAIRDALRGALLTDDEMAAPYEWGGYDDPFGDWHEDPCDAVEDPVDDVRGRGSADG